jgi:drug/metabolite transporter (DMT)-like permease
VSGVTPGDFTGGGSYVIGIGQALLAALLYGLSTLVTMGVPPRVEQWGSVTGVRPHLIALVQVVVGIPLLLPFADFGAMSGTGSDWGWLAGLGFIHTGVMYVLMYAAYAQLPTSKIAVLAFVYPAVAMVMDWAVYGHHIGLVQALGVPLIVTASLKVTLARPRAAAPAPRTAGHAPEAVSRPATPAACEA